MSHYLFLPMPGHGHVNPTLAVAARLVARGHRVTYLLPEPFREAVTATGAELVGYDGEQAAAPPVTAGGPPIAALTNMLMDTAERVAEPVLELYDRLRPDLVVHESMSLWGRLVTEARSAKGLHLSPSYPMGHHSPVARRFTAASAAGGPPFDVARLLAVGDRYGVRIDDPAGFLWRPAARTVVFMPVEFHPGGEALGDAVHFVGPALDRPDAAGPAPAGPESADGVYVSLGTVFNDRREFFQACLEAFGGGDRPVVINHGRQLGAADFTDVPDNVVLAPHVPQLQVLERSSAFVTHGGMGSTMEAITLGVPMVVVPQMIEQEVTADRVAELGLGVRLDPRDVTPATLADAVATVTTDPAYRAAVARMADAARAAGGAAAAADVLEAAAAA